MAEFDKALGGLVSKLLEDQGIETPMSTGWIENKLCNINDPERMKYVYDQIGENHEEIMNALGLDLNDDSLAGTPSRIAKMYCQEIFTGLNYNNFPKCTTVKNKSRYDEMIATRRIDVLSMCEHHFVPFIGYAVVGYLPNTKMLGLSKFNRVVDFFSRRPQIQERLTLQIYAALSFVLETKDVAVVIKAEHLCVRLRGVQQQSETITSKMGGRFMSKPELREEFLTLTR